MNGRRGKKWASLNKQLGVDAILIGIIPFAGSVVALAYECGYLLYFDIPFNLARLELKTILVAIVMTVLWVFVFWVPCLIVIYGLLDSPSPFKRKMAHCFSYSMGFSIFLFCVPSPIFHRLLIFVFVAIGCGVYMLGLFFLDRRQEAAASAGSRGEQIAHEAREDGELILSLFDIRLVAFYSIVMGAFVAGSATAEMTEEFLVTDKGAVVIRLYDDLVVTRNYDNERNVFVEPFSIQKVGDGRPQAFSKRKFKSVQAPNKHFRY